MTSPAPKVAATGLLVDDDTLYLQTLQRSLQKRGLAASIATNVADALQVAKAQPLDFALIDLRLGPESGLELIDPLRRGQPQYMPGHPPARRTPGASPAGGRRDGAGSESGARS